MLDDRVGAPDEKAHHYSQEDIHSKVLVDRARLERRWTENSPVDRVHRCAKRRLVVGVA